MPRIDWAEVRRRVEAAGEAIRRGNTPSPAAAQRILEERARALARPAAADAAVLPHEVIPFRRGGERYALEARYVVEVFRPEGIARLPGAPHPVAGVTVWRGDLLTLHDLRPAAGEIPRVLVVGGEGPLFGLAADEVEAPAPLDEASVGPVPEGMGGEDEHLRGITGDALLVLDAEWMIRTYTPGGEP